MCFDKQKKSLFNGIKYSNLYILRSFYVVYVYINKLLFGDKFQCRFLIIKSFTHKKIKEIEE